MAKIVHHEGNKKRTVCEKLIDKNVETTNKWAKVTCQSCKRIQSSIWRSME